MEVWVLMCDSGESYEPNVNIWGVYKSESAAMAVKCEEEWNNPEWEFWIEYWEVKE